MNQEIKTKHPPLKPTKKYISALLRSENIVPTEEAINQCFLGWLEAAKTPKGEREARTRAINKFVHGDCEQIGYCTYTYLTMLSFSKDRPKQLRMKI
jgi:hypothetical protein